MGKSTVINVPLKQIDKSIIESLISNEVRESRTLDYKEKLPGGKNEDKKEFLADVSATLPEKIRRFRDERLGRIVADELPVPLTPHPKVVLHLLPFSALDPMSRIDVSLLETRNHEFPPLSPWHLQIWGARYNLDGVLVTGNSGNIPSTYLQLFQSGAIEAVESMSLRSQHQREAGQDPIIGTSAFEPVLIVALKRFLHLLEHVQVEPPVVVMLSLVGVKGYRLAIPGHMNANISQYQIDRDTLLLPEGLTQSFEEPADKILQPAFDAMWQCVGYERDRFYQDSGKGRWSDRSDGKPPV